MSSFSQSLNFTNVNNTSSVAVVYPNTGTTALVYLSDKVKGDGYYGASNGLHTVTYTATTTFVGTATMQATLASAPVEADWFDIVNTSVNYTVFNERNATTVDYFNFTGNFVWIRGRVTIEAGAVNAIQYNH